MWTFISGIMAYFVILCLSVTLGNPRNTRAQSSTIGTHLNSNSHDTTSIDSQISNIDKRIDSLESQIELLNANIKQLLERPPTVSELETENAEIRRMLGNFERFFGSLYAEKPEAFDPEVGMEIRMSRLNQYLGNREAELVGLRPSPLTTIDSHETFDPELMGKVLAQITEENSKLQEKVSKLQEKVDLTIPSKGSAKGDVTKELRRRSARDLGPTNTQTTYEDIVTIERLVAQEVSSLLSNLTNSSLTTPSGNSSHPSLYVDIVDESLTVEEEVNMLAEDLLGMQASTRRRKSAFSVASTTSLIGSSDPQVVSFDHVYVNKGRDYRVEENTFVCGVTGHYFISFNLRTYENASMGVSLIKNGELMTAIYSEESERNIMESQSLILHLEQGDRLYLRLGPSERYGIYSNHFKYCTFSGFLLYRGNK